MTDDIARPATTYFRTLSTRTCVDSTSKKRKRPYLQTLKRPTSPALYPIQAFAPADLTCRPSFTLHLFHRKQTQLQRTLLPRSYSQNVMHNISRLQTQNSATGVRAYPNSQEPTQPSSWWCIWGITVVGFSRLHQWWHEESISRPQRHHRCAAN